MSVTNKKRSHFRYAITLCCCFQQIAQQTNRHLPELEMKHSKWFVNRQDADDHKRYLSRFMPAAEFEVIFDAPSDESFPTFTKL